MVDNHEHQAVLLAEAIEGLAIKPDGIYIDATFGRGGHSQAILKKLGEAGRLLAVDKDPQAIAFAHKQFATEPRFDIAHSSFAELEHLVSTRGWIGKVNGILLDLGVSSPQVDQAERGFSFLREGVLDMRMDPTQGMSAAQWLAQAKLDDMVKVFKDYGEERYAHRIANAIVQARAKQAITTTTQLADIVKAAHPKWERHKHPATRVFQALRIFINNELADLEKLLTKVIDMLAIGGRLVVISFHSLEDRIVKRFLRAQATITNLPKEIPVTVQTNPVRMRRLGGAIKPSAAEVENNIRARSAVLRIGEKIA